MRACRRQLLCHRIPNSRCTTRDEHLLALSCLQQASLLRWSDARHEVLPCIVNHFDNPAQGEPVVLPPGRL
jgi:hypothetical protein